MGTISGFPISTTKIDELPIYGAIDTDAKKKDLFEVSKNTGTSGTPVYASTGSKKITNDELIALLGIGGKKDVYVVTVLDSEQSPSNIDVITDVEITEDNDNDYFRLEIINRIYTDYWFNYFNLVLPVSPRNGFSFTVSFDTNGASTNDFDSFKFTSGYTYQLTWSSADSKWLYDRQRNITDHRPNYIYNNMNGLYPMPVNNGGQTYYVRWFQDTFYVLALPLLRLNNGEKITFVLIQDMVDVFDETETPLKFVGLYDAVLTATDSIIPNNGSNTYVCPPLCKKGSSWTFKAIDDTTIGASSTGRLQGWYLEHSNILL